MTLENNKKENNFDPFKLDLYSVGVVLLYLVTLGEILENYDPKNLDFVVKYFSLNCN